MFFPEWIILLEVQLHPVVFAFCLRVFCAAASNTTVSVYRLATPPSFR